MRQYLQDKLIAVFGLALVVGGLWLCGYYEADTALFPRICLICIGGLLAMLGMEGVMTGRRLAAAGRSGEAALPMNWGPFFIVTLTLVIYGAALIALGFYCASVLLLLAVGFLWKGVKRPTILVFTACFTVFLFVCFTILFNVPLPKGLVF
jgi:hypothetical protein